MTKRRQKAQWQRQIALERIEILFKQADKRLKANPELSKRYIQLARKIAMRYLVKIPVDLKQKFCKKCGTYLKPGVNCRIRLNPKGKVRIITCLECNAIKRIPYGGNKHGVDDT